MWKDFVFSFRTLRRSPMFTVVAVISLALGIGANSAIFSLVDQVVLRHLPVREPERLVRFHTDFSPEGLTSSDNFESVFSHPLYRELVKRSSVFEGVIARMGARVTLSWQGSSEVASAEMVSGNFFQVLGTPAAVGRVFTFGDDTAPGANSVIMLGYAYWSSRFARSAAILNQAVNVNGHPMVVVGVAGASFRGVMPGNTPDVFIPLSMKRQVTPTWDGLDDTHARWLSLFARLKPGVTLPHAQAATDPVYRSILETELARAPGRGTRRAREEYLKHRVQLKPAAQGISELRQEWEKPLSALMAMVAVVLLIACANVASLMLARASGRQKEIAIRLAMGAGRGVLLRQLLAEGLLLSFTGGFLGLLVASWSTDALIRLLPGDVAGNWLRSSIDLRILAFTLAISFFSGILFSLIPALQATRPDVAGTLKNQAASVFSGGGMARFRKAIVTAQVALSVLLLVGAGLFTDSLFHLMNVNLGFRTERLLMFGVDATQSRHELPAAVAFYHDFLTRLQSIGEISSVAAADSGPFSGSNRAGNLTVEGYQPKNEDDYVGGRVVAVTPGFFAAMGIPLRAGREFGQRDDTAAPKVVVINEAFARRYFAGRNPVGQRLMFGASNKPVLDREIVGVAADSRFGVREPARETLYFPYTQWSRPEQLVYYVRANGDENRLAATIRQVLRATDPDIPVRKIQPITINVRESIYSDRLIAMLSLAFGALATLLAAIGLYGVIAYAVARRTPEIGIRVALGAVPSDVLRMVMGEAARMAVVGIGIGLLSALALGRLVQAQLFGVKAGDPLVFAGAAILLAAVALLAAFVPGRRASRVDPMRALKYD